MRVLQLIDSLEAGGAERMAVNLANAIAQENIVSILCATRKGGDLETAIVDEVGLEILYKKNTTDLKAILSFFSLVRFNQINIIHAHSTSLFLAVLGKMRYPKLKIVWHNHYGNSLQMKGFRLFTYQCLSRFVHTSIALNEELLRWSQDHLKAKKHLILKNFVELKANEQLASPLHGLSGKRVLCLANLRKEKNHLALINAFMNSIKNHPEWTLHLVGRDAHDAYSTSIHDCIHRLKAQENIFVYGSRSDVSAILEQCDIGVLVSIFEAEPLSLIEYGMAGLPVIATDVGKCSEILDGNGILLQRVDNELTPAFERLFSNEDERDALGKRFRESVEKTYSQEATMKKLLPIYKALVS